MATAIDTFLTGLTTVQAHGPVYQMKKEIGNSVHEETLFLKMLQEDSKDKHILSGSQYGWSVEKTSTLGKQWLKGTTLKTDVRETTKTLTLPYARLAWNISYYLSDMQENRGDENRIAKYVASRIELERKNAALTLSLMLYGDGSTLQDAAATDISGLPAIHGMNIIAPVESLCTTTTYAQQARSSSTYWLNSNGISLTGMAASLTVTLMQNMMTKCGHGYGSPNLIVTNSTTKNQIWGLCKAEKWPTIRNERAYDLGFPGTIDFSGAAVYDDKHLTAVGNGGISNITSDVLKIYFINTKALEFHVDSETDLAILPEIRPVDQLSYTQQMIWLGILACLDPRSFGCISAAGA